ncbi:MAG: hypothetical protein QOK46_1819 [Microbacteriaceae bacterium]|jgi:hypothetical protein|nr:hypothetical protein [Microbacteriaceae bacterium]
MELWSLPQPEGLVDQGENTARSSAGRIVLMIERALPGQAHTNRYGVMRNRIVMPR